MFKNPKVLLPMLMVAISVLPNVSEAGWLREAWSRKFSGTPQVAPAQQAVPAPVDFAVVANPSADLSKLVMPQTYLEKLPAGIRAWLRSETVLLSRSVDGTRLMTPEQNAQNHLFTPEAGNVFQLHGYWVDSAVMNVHASDVPDGLRSLLIRQHEGKEQVLFFVHPESRSFYEGRLDLDKLPSEVFFATSTASSRSLLVWKPGHESNPFVAKVSLNAVIGNVERTVKGTEGAMSIGIDMILHGGTDLPPQFSTFREVLSAIPDGMERGAMIIREIPRDMVEGRRQFIPFFALYAKPGDGTKPLLLQMLQASDQPAQEFIKHRIIEPFIDEWFHLAIDNGVLMEPHAQNVLIEIGNKGFPVGRFRHRDFGGFNIDLNFRRAQGLYVPPSLPLFTGSEEKDYHLASHEGNVTFSLNNYFDAGFIFNVEKNVIEWSDAGLIKGSNVRAGDMKAVILDRVRENLQVYLGDISHMTMDYQTLPKLMMRAREKHAEATRVRGQMCKGLFAS